MGFPISPGQNVPAWLVDATSFGDLLTRLNTALQGKSYLRRVNWPTCSRDTSRVARH